MGERIFHIGEDIGAGQIVKAAQQSFIGVFFAAIFESKVLGTKTGVKGEPFIRFLVQIARVAFCFATVPNSSWSGSLRIQAATSSPPDVVVEGT